MDPNQPPTTTENDFHRMQRVALNWKFEDTVTVGRAEWSGDEEQMHTNEYKHSIILLDQRLESYNFTLKERNRIMDKLMVYGGTQKRQTQRFHFPEFDRYLAEANLNPDDMAEEEELTPVDLINRALDETLPNLEPRDTVREKLVREHPEFQTAATVYNKNRAIEEKMMTEQPMKEHQLHRRRVLKIATSAKFKRLENAGDMNFRDLAHLSNEELDEFDRPDVRRPAEAGRRGFAFGARRT